MPNMAYLFNDQRTAAAALGLIVACAQSLQKALENTSTFSPPPKAFLSYSSGFVTLSKRYISTLESGCAIDPKQGDLL